MPGYVIAEIEVTDPQGFEEYRRQVVPTIARFGGKYLVRGGACEAVEGNWLPQRLVVLEFESAARAREWWSSEDYRPARELRNRTAASKVIIVEGVDPA